MQQDFNDALRELQCQLLKGISFNELQSSCMTTCTKTVSDSREQFRYEVPPSSCRRLDVEKWLQKHSDGHAKSSTKSSTFADLVEKSVGGDNVISQENYLCGNYEIVVLSKIVCSDYHILVAVNMKGVTVLHWGLSKLSREEWLAPPSDILPEKSKMVAGACQTYFTDISTGKGSFQFVIWSGGSWIKNKGANFFAVLHQMDPNGKVDGKGKGIVIWLLDEISKREKEAERSLMHRYNIATELTERCKGESELGLIGILVWLRFMACRHLTWNKNYNVKPR
ncbi:hypothetical protein Patl1_08693 [Pistacia atlantica]|uniref:Uncharacterized protein n=1 Tax=Pistacia atlantica TaxID=434234 RepID=A0ACC1AGW9_9ROSI|nr:hypothetical protein Patl1_08693 [Pistacia atlantica]